MEESCRMGFPESHVGLTVDTMNFLGGLMWAQGGEFMGLSGFNGVELGLMGFYKDKSQSEMG